MLKFALTLALLVIAAEANSRRGPLPHNVWQKLRRIPQPDEKIVGGSEVEPNSIPYQVSLQYPSFDFHFCGGSIYNKNTIITAAHCCDGQSTSDLRVNAGEHSLDNNDGTEQLMDVAEILMHPQYNPSTIYNDICLLRLAGSLELNKEVNTVDLDRTTDPSSGDAVVSGWGTLSPGGSSPDKLHSVTVPIVTDAECRDAYGQNDVADSMICAGEAGKDSCQGDSGGPMTCNGLLCGIVSWGYSCAAPGYPGVYTEVGYFVDWILENTK